MRGLNFVHGKIYGKRRVIAIIIMWISLVIAATIMLLGGLWAKRGNKVLGIANVLFIPRFKSSCRLNFEFVLFFYQP